MNFIKFLWRNIFIRKRLYQGYKEFRQTWDVHYQETLQAGDNPLYLDTINYLKKNGPTFYPYPSSIWGHILPTLKHPIFWDSEEDTYLYINKKKIYCSFPTFISIICEQSGGAHKYFSKLCPISDGDTLVDVGAAEGMIALNHIEQLKKAYLIESDVRWKNELEKTFAPYSEKVKIIYKAASDINDNCDITLDKLLENEHGSIVVKMDVEGYERKVLAGCKQLLKRNNVKFVVCTYHNDTDADDFKSFFAKHGYNTEFSEGYLWVPSFSNKAPYLNKGVIRAWK